MPPGQMGMSAVARWMAGVVLCGIALPAVATVDGPGTNSSAAPATLPRLAATAGARARFPVRVEVGRRFLVDAQGRPFLVNGDTAWSLLAQLTREQAVRYLEDRRTRGFNAILVNLIEHEFAAMAPRNAYGEAPFNVEGDFTTPNERYFAHVDFVLASAADKGLLVFLAPAYAGYGGGSQGWYQEMRANGEAGLRWYGEYLGKRYRDDPNLVWVQGGDYDVADKNLVRALANGIRRYDDKPQTYHGARGTAALEFWGRGEPWLTVNSVYSGAAGVVADALREFEGATVPFVLLEAGYEGHTTDAHGARVQAYQAVLSGATGHVFGNDPVWHFGAPAWPTRNPAPWYEALDSPGARSVSRVAEVIAQRRWWALRPDADGSFLTGGRGVGVDRAVAARADDGTLAVVYLPTARPVRVRLGGMAGPRVLARWIDPVDGSVAPAGRMVLRASGWKTLRPAGLNGAGEGDWILLLESLR